MTSSRSRKRAKDPCSLRRLEREVEVVGMGFGASPRERRSPKVRVFDRGEPVREARAVGRPSWATGLSAPQASGWEPVVATSGARDVEPFLVEEFSAPPALAPSAPHAPLTGFRPSDGMPLPLTPDAAATPRWGMPLPSGGALVPSPDEVDDDLESITGKKPTPPAPPAEPVRPVLAPRTDVEASGAGPGPAGQQVAYGHSVFDSMAKNLRYAATFDLGSVDLERRFDALEREMDLAESRSHAAQMAAGTDLDEAELAGDLAMLTFGSRTAVPPAPPAPPAPPTPPAPAQQEPPRQPSAPAVETPAPESATPVATSGQSPKEVTQPTGAPSEAPPEPAGPPEPKVGNHAEPSD